MRAPVAFVAVPGGPPLAFPSDSRSFRQALDALPKLQRLVDAAELDAVDVVFDVGANVGHFSALAHRKWPKARIYAFEPSEAMCGLIAANNTDGAIVICPDAICEADGETRDFFIDVHAEQTNSLLKSSLDWFARNSEPQVRRVRTASIDAFCRREGIARIDVLKVDTQGGESALLKGAPDMIARTRCALFEASFLDPDPLGMLETLHALFGRMRVVNLVLSGADLAFDRPKGEPL